MAATSEPIEFETGKMTGHATGADYSSDSGMLMLHSAVSMSGMAGQRPVSLTATSATLDNRNQEAFLTNAKYASMGRTMAAKQATLHSRPDGTLARVEAQGDVTAVVDGATIVSQRGDFVMNATNQLQSALLTGGVTYSLDMPLQQRRGKAEQAAIGFDAKGEANHAVFTGAVHMTERTRATAAEKEPWSQRDLTAAKVEVALEPAGAGRSQVRDVEATGGARMTMLDAGSLKSPAGKGTTELSADDLKAHMLDVGDAGQTPRLDTVAGVGNTVVRQVGADGLEQTSAGDTLNAKFRPGAFVKQAGGGKAASKSAQPVAGAQVSKVLVSAVQQGHVVVVRRVPAKSGGGKEDVERATAQRVVYDGDLDRVTLTGGVELMDADGELWARQVMLDHGTGDARAEGGVKADLAQGNTVQSGMGQRGAGKSAAVSTEPMHILADRAEMDHASGIATFYGAPVRLWQQGSQVQAPVIEFAREQKRLVARGVATGAANGPQVHTVLVSGAGDQAGATGGGGPIAGCPVKTVASGSGANVARLRAPQVMRIASGGLTYSGLSHEADFNGGVWAEGDGGTIRAGEAEVFLQQPPAGESGAKAGGGGVAAGSATAASVGSADVGSLAGKIERMVAIGAVVIDEPGGPGIHATGARLVYTANDQDFLLTGEKGAPPKAVDGLGRSTTGAALRFHSCDASGGQRIEALGAVPDGSEGGPAQRVRTESLVDEEKKTAKKKQ